MFSPILIIVFPLLNDVLGSTKVMISVKPKGIIDESGDTRIHEQVEETKLTVILLEHPRVKSPNLNPLTLYFTCRMPCYM